MAVATAASMPTMDMPGGRRLTVAAQPIDQIARCRVAAAHGVLRESVDER